MRLVMWDVDGTLLHDRGRCYSAYVSAFTAFTGHEFRAQVNAGGRTDRWITAQVFAQHGIEVRDGFDEFFARYAAAVAALPPGPGPAQALPGVAEVLAELHARPHVVQTLVTGNIAPVAAEKVRNVGLVHYLDTSIGGYGEHHEERAELVRTARARAEAVHGPVADSDVLVVGDTEHDVRAALDCGVVAVGVATGRTSAAELAAAGAHHVLADLTDTATALAVLAGVPAPARAER
ncbi:HAD family hydrolase [Pseudonocardia thermophila]|uniref:HAD family hydrolase n=1 Tax=Pseudonocardia thermophila TaxID=1848 RepID=UPI00248F113C|nr:HAD family hydrolase [Pseudonocardia thermophila]